MVVGAAGGGWQWKIQIPKSREPSMLKLQISRNGHRSSQEQTGSTACGGSHPRATRAAVYHQMKLMAGKVTVLVALFR